MSQDSNTPMQPSVNPKVTPFTPGPAANAVISLSQAILAPLDAISKAQVHAARSFLNFVLQIGYPHAPIGEDGKPRVTDGERMYSVPFNIEHTTVDNCGQALRQSVAIEIPTLALVPIQPIGIESASFDVELVIKELAHHAQIQKSEAEALQKERNLRSPSENNAPDEKAPRPWYLVAEPISIRGTLTSPGGVESNSQKMTSVKVHVELKSTPTPAGLTKLLTAMTQGASARPSVPQTPSNNGNNPEPSQS